MSVHASRPRSRSRSPWWRHSPPAQRGPRHRRPRIPARASSAPSRSPATGRRSGCAEPARSTSSSTPAAASRGCGSARPSPPPAPASSPSPPPTSPPTPSTAASSSAAANSPASARGPRSTAPPASSSSPPATASTAAAKAVKRSVWSDYLQFVPAYNGGVAPFGSFVARRNEIYAPKQWTKHGNPDFDIGAFLTLPNAEGVNVADAVGGGATIVIDLTRHQTFQTFGYPGEINVHAEMHLALHRRRPALQPLPRPAHARHPLPLGTRRQRRRLADRRRHPDQRRQHLPAPQQQVAHLRPLFLRTKPSASSSRASEPTGSAQASRRRR